MKNRWLAKWELKIIAILQFSILWIRSFSIKKEFYPFKFWNYKNKDREVFVSKLVEEFNKVDDIFSKNINGHNERMDKIKSLAELSIPENKINLSNPNFEPVMSLIQESLESRTVHLSDLLALNFVFNSEEILNLIPENDEEFNSIGMGRFLTDKISNYVINKIVASSSQTGFVKHGKGSPVEDSLYKKCISIMMGESSSNHSFTSDEIDFLVSSTFSSLAIEGGYQYEDEIRDLIKGDDNNGGLLDHVVEIDMEISKEQPTQRKKNQTIEIIETMVDDLNSQVFRSNLMRKFSEESLSKLVYQALSEKFYADFLSYFEEKRPSDKKRDEIKSLLDVLYTNRESILNEVNNKNLRQFHMYAKEIFTEAIEVFLKRDSYYDSIVDTKSKPLIEKIGDIESQAKASVYDKSITQLSLFCKSRNQLGEDLKSQWEGESATTYKTIKLKVESFIDESISREDSSSVLVMFLSQIKLLNEEMETMILRDLFITYEEAMQGGVRNHLRGIYSMFAEHMTHKLKIRNNKRQKEKFEKTISALTSFLAVDILKTPKEEIQKKIEEKLNHYKKNKIASYLKIDQEFINYIQDDLIPEIEKEESSRIEGLLKAKFNDIDSSIDFSQIEFHSNQNIIKKVGNIGIDIARIFAAKLTFGGSAVIESLASSKEGGMCSNDALGAITSLKEVLGDSFREDKADEIYEKCLEYGEGAIEIFRDQLSKADSSKVDKNVYQRAVDFANKRWNVFNHEDIIKKDIVEQYEKNIERWILEIKNQSLSVLIARKNEIEDL